MSLIYAVRCNFARRDLEDRWNDWYSGVKLALMLDKPHFLSGQRFSATALDEERRYLALWHVESAAAFETREYRTDWGFFEWTDYITDWSRDLFQTPAGHEPEHLRIGKDEYLYLASFDGLSGEEAKAELDKIRPLREGVTWVEAVGLDRHTPLMGFRRLTNQGALFDPLPSGSRVKETIFTPISHFANSSAAALAPQS